MNIRAAYEHVPEIERYIRTVKERVRSIATTLPFKRYLPCLIVQMVYNCVLVEHFSSQRWHTCNNKPKNNNDRAKDNIHQT